MSPNNHYYIGAIQRKFEENRNDENALYMKNYMKGHFEFYGLKSGPRREITKSFLTKDALPDYNEVPAIIQQLWEAPQREFQLFGQELAQKYVKKCSPDFIELIEYMITHKSWWDTVDYIAKHLAGAYFNKYPEQIPAITKKWLNSDHMWLNRSALLFQLGYKENTDNKLLFDYIRHLADSKEFFIRKAIGWTLREYSKVNPQAVIDFIDTTDLSPLSQREAIRLIIKDRKL